jgi:hypothetical protein
VASSAIITSAYPPSTVILGTTGFWQFTGSPRLHGSHTPSSPPKNPTQARILLTRRPEDCPVSALPKRHCLHPCAA